MQTDPFVLSNAVYARKFFEYFETAPRPEALAVSVVTLFVGKLAPEDPLFGELDLEALVTARTVDDWRGVFADPEQRGCLAARFAELRQILTRTDRQADGTLSVPFIRAGELAAGSADVAWITKATPVELLVILRDVDGAGDWRIDGIRDSRDAHNNITHAPGGR